MSSSRAESQHPPSGRKRSNTVQSILRSPITPATVGTSKLLKLWVHDSSNASDVVFNHDVWPAVSEGDMIEVSAEDLDDPQSTSNGFLFIVPRDEGHRPRNQLQISVARPIADAFELRNHAEVVLTKVDQKTKCATYIEIVFQDQYLGRCDMWRLGKQLQGRCVHVNQEISFVGSITVKIQKIYIDGKNVFAGYVTSVTKAVYRSLSAKATIFIQVCRELWDFSGDGERYNEKIVHSFLPALFRRWRDAGTNHIVTIVLMSRVFYEQSELEYAEGPLRQDDTGSWYKDFFKVITDLEAIQDWKPTLVSLKESFGAFKKDILRPHHYHRTALLSSSASSLYNNPNNNLDQIRLVGRISYAHEGPILEALNLALNPTETHYIDRSLSLTGVTTILITPGSGYYHVSKRLLRLTTTRMLDQGFGLNLVSLTKPPLHQRPVFSFQGYVPEPRLEKDAKNIGRNMDPLWGGEDELVKAAGQKKIIFWRQPFWISLSFWDPQMDLPFREDRFVARAKMHQIQMLGLQENNAFSTVRVPYLPEFHNLSDSILDAASPGRTELSKVDADKFDLDQFALKKLNATFSNVHRSSISSSVSSHTVVASRSLGKRDSMVSRTPLSTMRLETIEASPRVFYKDLPAEGDADLDLPSTPSIAPSISPSKASVISGRSGWDEKTLTQEKAQAQEPTASARNPPSSLTSKFTSSWLFNPFRTGANNQSSTVSISTVSPTSETKTQFSFATQMADAPFPHPPNSAMSSHSSVQSLPPRPVTIRSVPSRRSTFTQRSEEDLLGTSPRGSFPKHSPMNASPRDDSTLFIRRPMTSSLSLPSGAAQTHTINPLRPPRVVPYLQAALASRWQHMFPHPVYEHQIKWKFLATPGCLPLTTEHFPTKAELESSYEVIPYDFVVDQASESFLIKVPAAVKENVQQTQARQACALIIMRGMAALRLAQGFQFVVRPKECEPSTPTEERNFTASRFFLPEDDMTPKPAGASEALQSVIEPVYLSMSNEIHRIWYSDEAIHVRRYVRRMPQTTPFEYRCLVWPKLGVGYTELTTSFASHGLESYGWNRVDMLVAGYEQHFNESLRYWRTRFVVIPTIEPPPVTTGPANETMSEEEVRLLGIDKLAELFTKARWIPPGETATSYPPVRFLPTYLSPTAGVLDESLISQLEDIQETGPLGKKMKSETDIADLSLAVIAKAMREDGGLPIKDHRWHGALYQDSFTGYDFVSWLVREFRDVSTREQGSEWGSQLQQKGLIEHCRGLHGFLDGHYFYRLRGEYAVPATPSRRWFRGARHVSGEEKDAKSSVQHNFNPSRQNTLNARRPRKRLVLSQTMVIDADPLKKSDQAETVILHHDIIHNPATAFHFELNWIGTTGRLIEDLLRVWSRTIERYGLKLVESYVTQISDIRDRNPFQSCYPIHLGLAPPTSTNPAQRVPEGMQNRHHFEYALLRKFDFVLDTEARDMYPDGVDVFYSYRRSSFTHSQFVHRTGVAFIQVLGDLRGFLFLTNRLIAPGRMSEGFRGTTPAAAAEDLRIRLNDFCSDKEALAKFYEEQLALLPVHLEDTPIPEEPPELSI